MRFSIEHSFHNTSLERYLEVYFSDAFNNHVDSQIGVALRDRLEHQVLEDGRVCTRTRVVPSVRLPRQVSKLIGREQIEYFEVSTFKPSPATLEFCIEHAAGKHLLVWGLIHFVPLPEGVRRVLDLNVQVDVPLVRRLVERVIESELRKSYARIAELMQRWLDEHAGGEG